MAPSIFFSIIIRPSKHPKQLVVANRHSIGQIYVVHQVYEAEAIPQLLRPHPTVAGRPSSHCRPRRHHLAYLVNDDHPHLSTTPHCPPLHVDNSRSTLAAAWHIVGITTPTTDACINHVVNATVPTRRHCYSNILPINRASRRDQEE
ncbi:hypothetical protein ACLOJK_010745 [Asimina triloba]